MTIEPPGICIFNRKKGKTVLCDALPFYSVRKAFFNRILPISHGRELSHGHLSYKRGWEMEYSAFQYLE